MQVEPGQSVVEAEAASHYGALYQNIRSESLARCEPLEIEDYQLQPMADVSPAKWHLAHTSWFFETFILSPHYPNYKQFHEAYRVLFNSYYNGVGKSWHKTKRGDLSRPTLREIMAYRAHVDSHVLALLNSNQIDQTEFQHLLALGLHHEQQHQELLLTDIKYCFALNPLRPAYKQHDERGMRSSKLEWLDIAGGTVEIGASQPPTTTYENFVYDNETPAHKVHLEPFRIASRLVTNGEFLAFIEDDGYRRPELWLAEGWDLVQAEGWCCPIYWQQSKAGAHSEYHLTGMTPLSVWAPVCHVSLYEADAYARWLGARLPTETEWEHSAHEYLCSPSGGGGYLVPQGEGDGDLRQMFDCLWQWTSSNHAPYPRFKPLVGSVGEYNGKFMSNQNVLKGSSFATPDNHARTTYRNYFYPKDRWQFTGIKLAKDS